MNWISKTFCAALVMTGVSAANAKQTVCVFDLVGKKWRCIQPNERLPTGS